MLGFLILSILNEHNAVGKLRGMSIKNIAEAEDLNCKFNTIYRQLMQFISSGYVANGIKDGHANTYYITTSGREFLKKEMEEEA